MKNKSVEFLNACIEQIDKLDTPEVERLKRIYEEETEKKSEETDFQIILPELYQ